MSKEWTTRSYLERSSQSYHTTKTYLKRQDWSDGAVWLKNTYPASVSPCVQSPAERRGRKHHVRHQGMPQKREWESLVCHFAQANHTLAKGLLFLMSAGSWVPVHRATCQKLLTQARMHWANKERDFIYPHRCFRLWGICSGQCGIYSLENVVSLSSPLHWSHLNTAIVVFTQILAIFLCHSSPKLTGPLYFLNPSSFFLLFVFICFW